VPGPKAQHFFCHLFEPGLSVCLWSLAHQTMTWLHRKLQDLSSNQCPWTMACKVVYCSSAKFLKYFFLPPHKVHSLLHPTELRNSVPVNKCVQQLLQRPHHQQEPTMHLQALDRAATRLSTKPGAESHSATIHCQLYPFSNSCFIPTMFFDLIMTKQCLNREDVKHRISLQYGCIASCHLDRNFDNIGRQNNTKYPFLKLLQRPHKKCFSVFFQHHFVSQVQLWFHRNHHLITLFLFYRCLWRRIPEGTMLEVTSRNVISAVCHHSTVLSNQDCYLVIVPTVICR